MKITEIVETWNDFAVIYNLAKVLVLTPRRRKSIKARLKEPAFDFDLILKRASESDFLLGRVTDWAVSFDFIFLSPNNYIKILEGNYARKFNAKGNTGSLVNNAAGTGFKSRAI